MAKVQVQLQISRTMHRIARRAGRPVECIAIAIFVVPGSHVHRLAGISGERHSKRKSVFRFESAEQIKLVSPVVIGAAPVILWRIAVSRKVGYSRCIVVGFGQSIARLAREIFSRPAAKCQFERIAFLVALGLHFANLPEVWIRPA